METNLSIRETIPNGWFKKVNKSTGEIEDTRKCFLAGDLSALLSIHYENKLRYNYLSLKPEVNGVPLADDEIENLYVALSERGYTVAKNTAIDALEYAAKRNGYHPVVEHFEKLEKDPKVKVINLDKVASEYLGTNSDLYDSMLKATLIGLVSRVFDRGCKFDTCCVLKGSQGIGKSSFWRILASDEWFCDTWQDKDQDLFMAIQTCVIYELAELDSMTSKKDAGKVKAILSSATDTFKRPYARGIGKHPRPSILVGSCNASDFLNDPTGSRRFWVIDLGNKFINLEKLKRDRDSIFKSALMAYRSKQKSQLTEKEQYQSDLNNRLYEAENPFHYQLDQWVNAFGEKGRDWESKYKTGFTTYEAVTESGCRERNSVKNADLKMAANALKDLDFELHNQTTKDGKRVPRKWKRINREPRQMELS